jgi:hypothetical protein
MVMWDTDGGVVVFPLRCAVVVDSGPGRRSSNSTWAHIELENQARVVDGFSCFGLHGPQ